MSGTHEELEKKAARLEKLANNLIKRHKERDRKEKSEVKKKEADTGYFCGENLVAAKEKEVEVIIPDQQFRKRDGRFDGAVEDHGKKARRYDKDDFEYDVKKDEYICPAGKALKYKRETTLNGKKGKQYAASVLDCRGCALREKCTWGSGGKRNNSHRTLLVMEETEDGKLVEEMKKIDIEKNRKKYAQRMQIIEPVFANITYCRG